MEDVALLAIELYTDLGLAPEEALGAARAQLAAAQFLLEEAIDLVAPMCARAQLPSRDDERVSAGSRRGGNVEFAQAYPGNCSRLCGRR